MTRASIVFTVFTALAGLALAGRASADTPFPDLPKDVVLVKDVTATSTYADKHDAYAAWRALAYETHGGGMDGSPVVLWSAWCEGKPDEGVGEALTIRLAAPTKLDQIKIAAGVWRTDKLFRANNQITALEVTLDGKPQTVKPKGKTWTAVKVGRAVSTIVVKLTGVKKGKMNDSCIAGIDLVRASDSLPIVIGVDAKAWAALPGAIRALDEATGARYQALEPMIEFPFTSTDLMGDVGGYGPSVTSTDASWKQLVAACKTYEAAMAKPDVDWVDPKGCPIGPNADPSDDRGDFVSTVAPGVVKVVFPSHHEMSVSWTLHWTDRWRLRTIGEE
jgi:hypothetical protein